MEYQITIKNILLNAPQEPFNTELPLYSPKGDGWTILGESRITYVAEMCSLIVATTWYREQSVKEPTNEFHSTPPSY